MAEINDYCMYIIVNEDLKMQKGKICSQVGHCVQKLIENILEIYSQSKKEKTIYINYNLWKNCGCKKIILKATHNEIIYLQNNYDCVSIYDAGKTQVEPNSLTCIGFYPTNNTDKFKKIKLL
jgi:PTH2 family peptidyl-tRNA hydrolase